LTVVQLMMEEQLKKPFPQIMSEAVLAPLGLKHSTFEQPLPAGLAATAATGTYASGKSVEGNWHVYPEMAAAGLWTTPSDLARIAIETSKAKAGKSKRVVSQAMAKQMLTKQSDGFGLGFQLTEGSAQFGHGGVNEGFQSSLIAFSDSGSGVVLMANSDNGMFLFERVAASVAAEYGWKTFTHRLGSPLMTADLLGRVKGPEAVIAWYKGMREAAPGQRLPPVLSKVGYGMLLGDRLAEAQKVFEAHLELFPEDADAYDNLGEVHMKAGRKDAAIASYKKSLALDPSNTNAAEKLKKLGASL